MDIIHTLGYTIASYIAVYTVLIIIGSAAAIWFIIHVFRKMHKADKEYEQMAIANWEHRKNIQDSMRERSERFQE